MTMEKGRNLEISLLENSQLMFRAILEENAEFYRCLFFFSLLGGQSVQQVKQHNFRGKQRR